MKEWYDAGAGAGREGIGLGKTGTAPGEDMERFGAMQIPAHLTMHSAMN